MHAGGWLMTDVPRGLSTLIFLPPLQTTAKEEPRRERDGTLVGATIGEVIMEAAISRALSQVLSVCACQLCLKKSVQHWRSDGPIYSSPGRPDMRPGARVDGITLCVTGAPLTWRHACGRLAIRYPHRTGSCGISNRETKEMFVVTARTQSATCGGTLLLL